MDNRMIVQEPVKATIWFCLDNYAYSDAIFLAERLYAEVASEAALHLLASCYLRAGKPASAYSVLTRNVCKSSQCRYLLAKVCFEMKKFAEAEEGLLSLFPKFDSKLASKFVVSTEDLSAVYGELSSFVAQLLGQISVKTERTSRAVDFFKKSLSLNPFLWSSFESVVQLGAEAEPDKIFDLTKTDFSLCHGSNLLVSLFNSSTAGDLQVFSKTSTPSVGKDIRQVEFPFISNEIHSPFAVIKPTSDSASFDVFTPEPCPGIAALGSLAPQKPHAFALAKKSCLTARNSIESKVESDRASFGVFPLQEELADLSLTKTSTPVNRDERKQTENVAKPPPVKKDLSRRQVTRRTASTSIRNEHSRMLSQSSNINQDQGGSNAAQSQLRRSTRLFRGLSSVKENSKNRNQENNKTTTMKAPPKKARRQASATVTSSEAADSKSDDDLKVDILEKNTLNYDAIVQAGMKMQRSSAEGLMNLLRSMGFAQLNLGNYKLHEAISVLKNLPPKHQDSGWVLASLGKCYFELAQYNDAVNYFEKAREKEPHRLQGVEFHSTALWHLQQEVKLSKLSQSLIELDREAPQTWCAAGNCFSLQKEHEMAIKFLQRAIQVDPDFAYAYTLLGHELVLTEEMDHAMVCFRNAIRIDPRHYNAWYGIGMIYYKQEKYDLAEVHYRRAVSICPSSPNLRCNLGIVLHALKKTQEALSILDEAIRMNPTNALSRFHRASFYFALDRHEEALKELEELKVLVPKESLVYFLIGKVHKRLGNTHLALMSFSWAMDLDPKGANNQIKEVIDRQYAKDDDEEDVVLGLDSGDESSRREDSHEVMEADDEQVANDASFQVSF